MRPELPTGTVTFLFTDIEGSTRLLHALGPDAYAAALAEHHRVLREAFAAQGGVEVDTQGDAFFVAFPTAAPPSRLRRAAARSTAGASASGWASIPASRPSPPRDTSASTSIAAPVSRRSPMAVRSS